MANKRPLKPDQTEPQAPLPKRQDDRPSPPAASRSDSHRRRSDNHPSSAGDSYRPNAYRDDRRTHRDYRQAVTPQGDRNREAANQSSRAAASSPTSAQDTHASIPAPRPADRSSSSSRPNSSAGQPSAGPSNLVAPLPQTNMALDPDTPFSRPISPAGESSNASVRTSASSAGRPMKQIAQPHTFDLGKQLVNFGHSAAQVVIFTTNLRCAERTLGMSKAELSAMPNDFPTMREQRQNKVDSAQRIVNDLTSKLENAKDRRSRSINRITQAWDSHINQSADLIEGMHAHSSDTRIRDDELSARLSTRLDELSARLSTRLDDLDVRLSNRSLEHASLLKQFEAAINKTTETVTDLEELTEAHKSQHKSTDEQIRRLLAPLQSHTETLSGLDERFHKLHEDTKTYTDVTFRGLDERLQKLHADMKTYTDEKFNDLARGVGEHDEDNAQTFERIQARLDALTAQAPSHTDEPDERPVQNSATPITDILNSRYASAAALQDLTKRVDPMVAIVRMLRTRYDTLTTGDIVDHMLHQIGFQQLKATMQTLENRQKAQDASQLVAQTAQNLATTNGTLQEQQKETASLKEQLVAMQARLAALEEAGGDGGNRSSASSVSRGFRDISDELAD